MYSFYGGKQGASFIISKSFNSVQEMIDVFKQGYNYTEVAFDEYVLINTEDKTNEENGRLYRRGYEFNKTDENNNPTGGAVYIGTIVGPAGSASKLSLDTYNKVKAQYDQINNGSQAGVDSLISEGNFTVGADNGSLVPGSYLDDDNNRKFNDDITWVSVCVRNDTETDAETYVGLKIPYTVFDFKTECIDSKENPKVEQVPTEDGQFHPFYQKWNFSIPRGFKGDSFRNFRVEVANEEIEDYPNKTNDIEKGNQVYVCDFIIETENGEEVKKIYVGNYNVIKDINVSESGIITINYTNSEPEIINEENPIKYIDNIEVDSETQKIKVTYNTLNEQGNRLPYEIGEPLNAIQEMVINPDNYHLLVYYNSSIVRNQLQNSVAYPEVGENRKEGWLDLGSIKDESGILIGLNIPLITEGDSKNDTVLDAIIYLNREYPDGLEGINLKGKVVTIGNSEDVKDFYAYDYNRATWYYLGTFNNNIEKVILGGTQEEVLTNLSEGGVWLKVTEI